MSWIDQVNNFFKQGVQTLQAKQKELEATPYGRLATTSQRIIQAPPRAIAQIPPTIFKEYIYKPETKTVFPQAMWRMPAPRTRQEMVARAEELAFPFAFTGTRAIKPLVSQIPKQLEPLAQEARGYKRAEVFSDRLIDTGVFSYSAGETRLAELNRKYGNIFELTKIPKRKDTFRLELKSGRSLTDFYTQATKGVKAPEVSEMGRIPQNLQGKIPQVKELAGKPQAVGQLLKKRPEELLEQASSLKTPIIGEKGILPPPEIPGVPSRPSIPQQAVDPVQKVIQALREAKPLRGLQERLYTKERGQRLAAALRVGEKVKGEKGFYAELGQLKGELPKVQYESIRGKIGQEDIDNLFIKVKDSPLLNEWDKIGAREGLVKIFGEAGGRVPTEGELRLLNRVFGPEFTKIVLGKRPLLEKLKEAGYQLANIPRSLMASFDLSAPLRQGVFLIGRPRRFFSSFATMFKQFGSEKAFKEVQEEIIRRPTFELMRGNKLALTEMDAFLGPREEAFMSNWAEKIPLIGRMVRASGRAYVGFLNKLRADVFDDFVKQGKNLGIDDPAFLKSAADFVNTATGRGGLGPLERAGVALNSFFFSPRLMASRINLLNPAYYIGLHPQVRKEALKSLFTFAGTAMTVLGLAKMGGAEVGIDPRSADFGKIKVGKTRWDVLGGFQQYIRLAAQLIKGQIVSSTTGRIMTLGKGYRPLTRMDILGRFFEYKTAPVVSFALDLFRGQTALGEEVVLPKELAKRFIPMAAQDIYELIQERGVGGLFLSSPAIFGVGVQTYGVKEGTADWYYEKLSKLPPAEANTQAAKLKKTDPNTYARLKRIVRFKKFGITPEEEMLSGYGVEGGERAEEIAKRLNKLATNEEKNDFIKKLRKAGIVSDQVFKQLKKMKAEGKLVAE